MCEHLASRGCPRPEPELRELRDALKGGSVPARCALITRYLKGAPADVIPIMVERLDDPEEADLVKLAILRHGAGLLGERLLPFMRRALRADSPALGAAAAALDAWRLLELPLEAQDRELVAANMQRHPHVGWRAARLLAEHGDDRAKMQLEPGLRLGDRVTRFESACGLGLLEDAQGLRTLIDDLVLHRVVPERCVDALAAIRRLRDRATLPVINELLRNEDLDDRIPVAAREHLFSLGDADAVPGLMLVRRSLDPEALAAFDARLAATFGETVATRIVRASAFLDGITGRAADAEACGRVVDILGDPRACGPFALIAAGGLLASGRHDEASPILRELGDGRGPAAYRMAAIAMRKEAAPPSLRLVELVPVETGPIAAGGRLRVMARLLNTGRAHVPGGRSPGAPRFALRLSGADGVPLSVVPESVPLPLEGVAPGRRVAIVLTGRAPTDAQRVVVGLEAATEESGPIVVADADAAKIELCVRHVESGGLTGLPHTWRGAALVRDWFASSSFLPPVLNHDDSVSILAVDLDPILIGPNMGPHGRALRVTVSFDVEKEPGMPPAVFEAFYRYRGQERFVGQQVTSTGHRLDGVRRRLTFEIPQRRGESAVQLRLDPFQGPHLINLHEITVEPVDG